LYGAHAGGVGQQSANRWDRCVNAASAEDLGTAPDHLSARKVVPVGVEKSTQLLDLLMTNGHTATIEEFMSPPPGQTASQTSDLYVLLVGKRHICSKDRSEMARSCVPRQLVCRSFWRDLKPASSRPSLARRAIRSRGGGVCSGAVDKPSA